jgi:hypothetical protein
MASTFVLVRNREYLALKTTHFSARFKNFVVERGKNCVNFEQLFCDQ